jgi:hypothetical protein
MDIRIGIANSPRELAFESRQTPAEIEQLIASALSDGGTHVSISDDKGKLYIVPVASLSYVEIGSEELRRIGFVG